jgi:hypothetical protein
MRRYAIFTFLLASLLTGCNSSDTSTASSAANYPLFKVYGNQAHMNGTISSDIVAQLNAMTKANPLVDTIVMQEVPGSVNDDANLKAALLVRSKYLKTLIPEGGMVASGGTDFFLSGVERVIADGALVGVHSWADSNGTKGGDLPASNSAHKPYLDFYKSIGMQTDFYWYTLKAASANSIHWMSQAEMSKYNMATRVMTENEKFGVITVPAKFGSAVTAMFNRYTWVKTPDGKVVNIFAQPEVSLAQLLRARNTLQFYLTDTPTLNKTALANSMGDKGASLFIFKDQQASEDAFNGALINTAIALHGQDLYATEVFVEGDSRYLAIKPLGRDATMEEVLHLTQAYGIAPTLPTLQSSIAAQAEVALSKNVWNPEAEQLAEWRAEGTPATGNSVSHEYFAAIVEAYFGMWQNQAAGMDGYIGKSRSLQARHDLDGQTLSAKFLPENITTMMNIDTSFADGSTFFMTKQPALAYTTKSQYLLSVRLTGTNNSNISANDHDNVLMGNQGNNRIDGKAGNDTYRVNGLKSEFVLVPQANGWVLEDQVSDRNGTDTLVNIERIKFSDREHVLTR